MIPSFKKNVFEDKVGNKTSTISKKMKVGLLALVTGMSMANASTEISNADIVKSMMDADSAFVLQPISSPDVLAYHSSHQSHSSHSSHSSHQSHSSHYSSRY